MQFRPKEGLCPEKLFPADGFLRLIPFSQNIVPQWGTVILRGKSASGTNLF